ncbi:hypothetical protein HDR58_11045 [bacterium]|nr:hypothetical protein [bacterium]
MSITSVTSKVIGAATQTQPAQKLCNWFRKDPEKALAYSTIASVAVKDGVGCAMYVYQSLNNKKIPDDKRKFVASLDLTNGVLMIASQIGMFFAMRKLNKTLFQKWFNKSFDESGKIIKTIAEQIRADQKAAGVSPTKNFLIGKEYKKLKKDTFDVFKFVTELAAATIIGKRVIVPFIATPLASVVEKKMNEMDNKDGEAPAQETKKEDSSNPSMTGKNLDITESLDTQKGETNLLSKYKK